MLWFSLVMFFECYSVWRRWKVCSFFLTVKFRQAITPWDDSSVSVSSLQQLSSPLQITIPFVLFNVLRGITSTSISTILFNVNDRFIWSYVFVSTLKATPVISLNQEPVYDMIHLPLRKMLILAKSAPVLFTTRYLVIWIGSDGTNCMSLSVI